MHFRSLAFCSSSIVEVLRKFRVDLVVCIGYVNLSSKSVHGISWFLGMGTLNRWMLGQCCLVFRCGSGSAHN